MLPCPKCQTRINDWCITCPRPKRHRRSPGSSCFEALFGSLSPFKRAFSWIDGMRVLALSGSTLLELEAERVEDLELQVEQQLGVERSAQRLVHQGSILASTALLSGVEEVTLVVTSPTVEYQVVQGVLFKSKQPLESSKASRIAARRAFPVVDGP